VQSLARLGELLTHDYVFIAETDLSYGYYRPLTSLSLALDFRCWGPNPFGFHLTNLILHAASSLLVLLLARGLGAGRGASWAAGLLFAVHPIHTESVTWIAGRTDVLAFLLAGASLGLYLEKERAATPFRRGLALGASLLLFALALLAKEMAAVVPLWIVCIAWWRAREAGAPRGLATALRVAAPWCAVVLLYAVVRFAVLDVPPPEVPAEHTPARALASAPVTLVRYLGWMAFPGESSAYVQNPYVTRLADPRLLGSLALLALATGLLARQARRRPAIGLLGAMLAVSFAPILNAVRIAGPPDMGAIMAERFAYFPSFVFLLLVTLCVESAVARPSGGAARRKHAGLAWAGLAGVALLLARGTVKRNRDWRDEVTFFSRETARTPGAPLLWTNLAQAEMRAGRQAEAEAAIRRAEALSPLAPWVLAVRAQWLTLAGRYADALPIQERVVRAERKGNALALNNLAFLQRSTGRTGEAQRIVQELVVRLPSYPDPWLNLAEIERAAENLEPAIAAYVRYLDLRPRDLRVVETLANLFASERRFGDAEAVYTAALRGDALDARIWNNIGSLRLGAGDAAGALQAVEHALAIDLGSARARFNRAKLLQIAGRTLEAQEIFAALVREVPASEVGTAAKRELAGVLGENPGP
jgi:protein O-mannosyl-transferase